MIVQLGIVDCAPRKFYRTELEIIRSLPSPVAARVKCVLQRIRSRRKKRAYVAKSWFESNLRDYARRATEAQVDDLVFIQILSAGEKYKAKKNPAEGQVISEYNDAIADVAADFDVARAMRQLASAESDETAIVDRYTVDDGYHLDGDGHRRVLERLSERVPTIAEPQVGSRVDGTTDNET